MCLSVGVSSSLSSSRRQHQHVVVTEKYLQAVKSLLKARSLDSENPELHVRTADFQNRGSIHPSHVPFRKLIFTWTVSSLPQPPPEPIGHILTETLHTLLPGDVTLETFNSQYLQRHSSFPPAVLAAAKVSRTLGVPGEELEAMLFTTLAEGTLLDIKVIFNFERSIYPSVSCARRMQH
jgi:peptide alpha-N-acetyltransferase